MKLLLDEDAGALETFAFFKKIEAEANERFIDVTDFQCSKMLYSNIVTATFFHCGKKSKQIDNEANSK